MRLTVCLILWGAGLAYLATEALQNRPGHGGTGLSDYHFFDIQIWIAGPNLDQLRKQPRAKVHAECEIGGTTKYPVWLHLKGTSTFDFVDGRPNFSVKPRNGGSPTLAPIFRDKFYLHNSNQDDSLLRDWLAKSIHRSVGVAAPRVAFAKVQINERNLGFYVVCEGISKQFLHEAFGDPDGYLFEGEFSDVPVRAMDDGAYNRNSISALTSDALCAPLSAFDTSNLQAYVAADVLSGNGDGFVSNANNYWVYRPTTDSELLRLMPHTSDDAFTGTRISRWQKPKPHAVKQLMQHPEHREQVVLQIAERCSKARSERFLSEARKLGCRLLDDIILRDAASANRYCKAFQALNEAIARHHQDLRIAVELDRGLRGFWHDPNDPANWTGLARTSRLVRNGKNISLECASTEQPAGILFETFARPGRYSLFCAGQLRPTKSAQNIKALRLGVNGVTTEHILSASSTFAISRTIELHQIQPGLFEMEKLATQLIINNYDGFVEFDALRLQRVANSEESLAIHP